MSAVGLRGFFIGALFIGLILALIACWIYGRRLIKNEKTDAVFGNPAKALGGWHWIVSGVATIVLIWLYFSWDAARAFFPQAANELCQVAKVNTAVNPIRSTFPFDARLPRGTIILERENRQIQRITGNLLDGDFTDEEREKLKPYLDRAQILLNSMAAPGSVDAETTAAIADVAMRIDALTGQLDSEELPSGVDAKIIQARETQPGWGDSNQEVPIDPTSLRGALFDSVATPMSEISSAFTKIRNTNASFLAEVDELSEELKAVGEGSQSEAVKDITRDMNKLLKRVDNGAVFPPGALDPIETALVKFDTVQEEKQGSLKWIDAIAMPSGTILAGNTACSEQGSGRWLPKPSDTFIKVSLCCGLNKNHCLRWWVFLFPTLSLT